LDLVGQHYIPKGRKLFKCKWVYKTKYALDGSVERHKARFIAKGFYQIEGIDYNETFSHVAKMNSIRLILSLATSHTSEVHQMDVKSTFLHGYLQEKIYMNNLLAMSRMTLDLFVFLRNLFMVLSKLLKLGMPKLTYFFLTPTFLDAILIQMSIPRK
jgi:hypothetical protein